ncbi:MAG TPA: hypothetical protein V6C84_18495 [Coleofasciculaceae cyanobacterium]|jgi:hypothetical protein
MEWVDWLVSDQFDGLASGLAISLLLASFVMILVTLARRKRG